MKSFICKAVNLNDIYSDFPEIKIIQGKQKKSQLIRQHRTLL